VGDSAVAVIPDFVVMRDDSRSRIEPPALGDWGGTTKNFALQLEDGSTDECMGT